MGGWRRLEGVARGWVWLEGVARGVGLAGGRGTRC